MKEKNVLHQLVNKISKLPGMGQKSARRIALHLMNDRNFLVGLINLLQKADREILNCAICGNLDISTHCSICSSTERNKRIICIVENISDLWAIERSQTFFGQYHVLNGLLSALNSHTPDSVKIPNLVDRIKRDNVSEVVIAISATLDGQTTAHYISALLSEINDLKISRLAFGIPIGTELEYMDEGTIGIAIKLRNII